MKSRAICGLTTALVCISVMACGETKVTVGGKTLGGTGAPAKSTSEIEAWMNSAHPAATMPTPHLGRTDAAKALANKYADALAHEIRQTHHIGALGIPEGGHRTGDTYTFRLDVSGIMQNLGQYDCTASQQVVLRRGTSTIARSAFACTIR